MAINTDQRFHKNIALLSENKLIIYALGKIHYQISRSFQVQVQIFLLGFDKNTKGNVTNKQAQNFKYLFVTLNKRA